MDKVRDTALVKHRRRMRREGVVRVEVSARKEDAPLIRSVARALSDPVRATEARDLLRQRFAAPKEAGLKALLAAAPLEGIEIERSHDSRPRGGFVSFLIDTNIISEVRKGPRCDPNVAAWYATIADGDLYLSVLALGEIRKGAELVRRRDPRKAESIAAWLARIDAAFGDRVLPIDRAVSDEWGRMCAIRPVPVIDGLMAATAKTRGLALVTRNIGEVSGLGAIVLNPFVSN